MAFIFVIFAITVASGLAPMKSKKFKESSHLLGIANTFSGGVFLAIAFVHIIPETATNYYLEVLQRHEVTEPQVSYRLNQDGIAEKVVREYTSAQIKFEISELL